MTDHYIKIIGSLIMIAVLASACQTAPASKATQASLPATATSIPNTQTSAPASATPLPTLEPDTPTPTLIPTTPTKQVFVFDTPTATKMLFTPTSTPVPQEAVWSFQTKGAIWGIPSVSNGKAFIGSDDGNLYAVDARTGKLTWQFATQGIVRSRPAIDNGLVYIASDDGYLYAVDALKGTQTWRTDIGNALARDVREKLGTSPSPSGYDYRQSSPVVASGKVFVGSFDGNIYALAADSGKIAWTYKTGDKVRATGSVVQGTFYVGSWDGYLYALDTQTGKLRWKTSVGGPVQSTTLVANGMVYTASRKASVFGLDEQTGDVKWEFCYGVNLWVESSPVLANGVIYIGSSGSKMLYGLNPLNGDQLAYYYSAGWLWSTPVILNNMLYIGAARFKDDEKVGGIYGLKLVNGNFATEQGVQWYFPANDSLEREGNWGGVASSPVLVNDLIYFGGLDGKLYAVKPASK